jgi:hypothetical protein
MITWVKPNGNEITTNEEKETIEYCESLGFERKDKKEAKKKSSKKSKD